MKLEEMWVAFEQELKRSMAEQAITAGEMERRLHGLASAGVVRDWRGGRSKPPLDLLPLISQVLGMGSRGPGRPHDPTYLLRKMGLLPDEPVDEAYALAYRIQKLEGRFRKVIERRAQVGRDHGLAAILQATRESGEWAVAVWPAVEGPDDCRMHVADRIDLRRIDGRAVSTADVFNDPVIHDALRDAYALPSARQPRWSDEREDVSSWAVVHVGSPTPPTRRVPHPGVSSVLCYALTVESWVNDVGGLLACALGYGLTTTRDLAMEVTGLTAGATTPVSRSQAHHRMLTVPPIRRVWTHHAPQDQQVPNPLAVERTDVAVAWLRESDAHLDHAVRRMTEAGRRSHSLEELIGKRDRLDELAAAAGERVIVVDVDFSLDATVRWQQSLDATAAIYRSLELSGGLDRNTRIGWESRAMSDPMQRPFLAWLANRLGHRELARQMGYHRNS